MHVAGVLPVLFVSSLSAICERESATVSSVRLAQTVKDRVNEAPGASAVITNAWIPGTDEVKTGGRAAHRPT
jgi:hypothetical protein